jgi:hypothetical protein
MRHIVYSDMIDGVRSRRPDPRPFREMRDLLEIPSNQILFVGDNPAKDFETPKYLGLLTCRVHTGPCRNHDYGSPERKADFEVTTAARLPDLLSTPQIDVSSYLHLPFLKKPEVGAAPLLAPESLSPAPLPSHPSVMPSAVPVLADDAGKQQESREPAVVLPAAASPHQPQLPPLKTPGLPSVQTSSFKQPASQPQVSALPRN